MRGGRLLAALALAAGVMISSGCHHVDNERIPWAEVRIVFPTVGDWNVYGVPGAGDWRRFIKSERVPRDYPYTQMTYTGFGGVLLVCDYLGNPVAYDLACPVEVKYDVRVEVNPDTHLAECPVCHSTYFIFENYGAPFSGPAAKNEWGLRNYAVGSGTADYRAIFNK